MRLDYDKYIRKVNDFPKKGILFYDLTSLFLHPKAFSSCLDDVYDLYKDKHYNGIACLESRGFILGAPLAIKMNLPLILIRKKNKLPGKTISKSYNLEYGSDTLELQLSDVSKSDKILLIDDLLATGGTISTGISLLEEAGAIVEDIFTIIDLTFLSHNTPIKSKYNVKSFVSYDTEEI